MVYFITLPDNLALVKELCESKDMGFEYTTNIKDIKTFVNAEMKKLAHIKHFVIDIDYLRNTDKEVFAGCSIWPKTQGLLLSPLAEVRMTS